MGRVARSSLCSRKVHDKKEMKGGVVIAARKDSCLISSIHLIHLVNTDEGSHRRRVLPRLLDGRIGEIEPLLEERDAPHPFETDRAAARSVRLRIHRLDQGAEQSPRLDRDSSRRVVLRKRLKLVAVANVVYFMHVSLHGLSTRIPYHVERTQERINQSFLNAEPIACRPRDNNLLSRKSRS